MNSATFSQWLDNALAETKSKLDSKAAEYATLDNRFQNFDMSANLLRCTPIEAAYAFMTKHITSIYEWYATGYIPTEEQAREKLGDVRNYCYIIEAMYKAERDRSGGHEANPQPEHYVWHTTGGRTLNPNDWIDKIPRPNEVICGYPLSKPEKEGVFDKPWFTSSIYQAGVASDQETVYQNGLLVDIVHK